MEVTHPQALFLTDFFLGGIPITASAPSGPLFGQCALEHRRKAYLRANFTRDLQ
jgi:hypothetical protein